MKYQKSEVRLLEPGDYEVTVIGASERPSSTNKPMLVLTLSAGSGSSFKEWLVLKGNTWKVDQFLDAVGKPGINDLDDLRGLTARARIGVREFNEQPQQHIEEWLAPRRAVAGEPKADATSQGVVKKEEE